MKVKDKEKTALARAFDDDLMDRLQKHRRRIDEQKKAQKEDDAEAGDKEDQDKADAADDSAGKDDKSKKKDDSGKKDDKSGKDGNSGGSDDSDDKSGKKDDKSGKKDKDDGEKDDLKEQKSARKEDDSDDDKDKEKDEVTEDAKVDHDADPEEDKPEGEVKDAVDSVDKASKQATKPAKGRDGEKGTAKDDTKQDKQEKAVQEQDGDDRDWIDDLIDLCEGEEHLSEQFKNTAIRIFRKEMGRQLKHILAKETRLIEEQFEEQLAQAITETEEQLTDMIDRYLDEVVNEWADDNRLAVEAGMRTRIAEDFIDQLKDLFETNYIEVPKNKADLVEDLTRENYRQKDRYKRLVEQHQKLSEEYEELINETVMLERDRIIRDEIAGMSVIQQERVMEIFDRNPVDYSQTSDDLIEEITRIKRTIAAESRKTRDDRHFTLTETEGDPDESDIVISDSMRKYRDNLSKISRMGESAVQTGRS